MNCGRSSSVEWKLPKLQRRVRFPSPAPPPPGYAPGGFVMPPRQARLASHALFHLPLAPLTRPCGRHRYKTLPARSPAGDTGTKLSLHPQNGPFQHVLRQQGELYTAPTTNRSSRENFVPHAGPMPVQNSPSSQPSGRHRYKTLPARSPAGDTGTKLPQHPQNGSFQHVLRQQGELYTACATNKPSREKKVPHQHPTSPTNAPLPQFRMQFYCMNFQQSPETLQSQRHEFKI